MIDFQQECREDWVKNHKVKDEFFYRFYNGITKKTIFQMVADNMNTPYKKYEELHGPTTENVWCHITKYYGGF